MTPGLMGVKSHPFKVRGLNRPRAGPSPPRSPASPKSKSLSSFPPLSSAARAHGNESSSGKGQDKEDGPIQF